MNPNQPYNPQPGQGAPNYPGPAGLYPPAPPVYGQPAAPYGPPQSPYGPPAGPLPPSPYGPVGPNPYGPPAPGYQPPFDPYADLRADPYGPPPKKSSGAGKKIAIAIVIVALIAMIAAMLAAGGTAPPATQQPKTTQQEQPAIYGDVMARSDGTLDLGKRLDTSKSIKPQSVQAKLKEQINLSSGFSFLVKEIDTYESTTVQPATGKKFIILQVVVGNRAEKENISVSYLDFKLLDSKNNLLTAHSATQQILNNLLSSPTQLKPGEQLEGRLVFEVDSADKEWSLTHKETYQKTTDNTTFTVEGKIAVSIKPVAPNTTPATPATPPVSPSPTAP